MSQPTSELEHFVKIYFEVEDPGDRTSVASLFQPYPVSRGEYLLEEGKRCQHLSFVQSGYLRLFKHEDGKEVTQWISAAGSFTTDLASFYFDSPARWNIQALTDVKLFRLSQADYQQINQLMPRWHELEKLFLVKCFTSMEDRIYNLLSMSSEERYDYFYENYRELFVQVPLKHIASMLGMTPETLSRIRIKQSQ